MKKISLVLAFAVMLAVSGAVLAQEGKNALTVSGSAVCTAISDRMPEGAAAEFSKGVEKIYYWTKIDGAVENTAVKHVWYAGENVIGEVDLNVTTPSFRTWSSKTLYPGLEGEMAVEVVDAAGNVLKRDAFTIK